MKLTKEQIYNKVAKKEITIDEAAQYLKQIYYQSHAHEESYPLTEGQKFLWYIYQFAPDNYAYNLPTAFLINQEVDINALKRSFQYLVNRHESLRTVFRFEKDEPEQSSLPDQELFFVQEDISLLSDEEILIKLKKEVKKPFDLEKGPLLRIYLYKKSNEEYILLLNFHHTISDGISSQVFFNELQICYFAEKSGEKYELPELNTTYRDFVEWERNYLHSEEGRKDKEYWLKTLSGEISPLEIYSEKARPDRPTLEGATQSIEIDESLYKRVIELSLSEGSSIFSILLTAYNLLLYRYSQQEEILIGTPVGGRPETRFENLIGYFLNIVVIKSTLSGNPTFKTLLKQVSETCLDAFECSQYPYFTLVNELRKIKNSKSSQFFHGAFYFQNWMKELVNISKEVKSGLLFYKPLSGINQEGEFDLTLEVLEFQNRYIFNFKYNTDIFSKELISGMASHYVQILQSIVSSTDQRISDIDILTPEEKYKILYEFNDTKVDYPDKCMHELFEEQAIKDPDSIAVICEDNQLTYKELNAKATQLAVYLHQNGMEVGMRAGLFMERSIDMLIGLLGILKSGGSYVPLDPIYPADRLLYMIDDTDLSFIITESTIEARLPECRAKLVRLDKEWDEIDKSGLSSSQIDEIMSHIEVKPDNLAYTIYTSGSTGKPKGVEVFHRGLTNFLCEMVKYPGFTNKDHILALTTVCFDIAALELYLPLITGGIVEILPESVARDGLVLKEKIENSNATVIQATPATFQMLLAAEWEKKSSMKILCGGEALSRELADKLLERGTEVWNMYGPTETTIWSSVSMVKQGENITIGKPLGNTLFYVLDNNLKPVPIGIPGELFIGGDGLAQGYHNRPDLTEERFILNPFDDKGDSKIYKTGDLARFLADGQVECLGRIDSQVKLRGFRIELEEIEIALNKVYGVQESVVVVREDSSGHKNLVAFLKMKGNIPLPATKEFHNNLKKSLPDYMIPSLFIQLNSFPLTLNQKVNRKSLSTMNTTDVIAQYGKGINNKLEVKVNDELPKEEIVQEEAVQEEVMPEEEHEVFYSNKNDFVAQCIYEDLVKITADILDLRTNDIDIHNNFGEYGFDSIRFATLSMKISKEFNFKINATLFYQYSTIKDLSSYMVNNYSDLLEEKYKEKIKEFTQRKSRQNSLKKKSTSPKQAVINKINASHENDRTEPIAIIGMSGRMPQSQDLESFWIHLEGEKDLVSVIPMDRWDWRQYYGDTVNEKYRINSKWGGFIDEVDKFDATFFGISPREADLMDPQQRLIIESTWKTIEDAGYKVSDFYRTKTGVFIGATVFDYTELAGQLAQEIEGHSITGMSHTIIPNRVSYLLDLQGPSVLVDTACSSSLIAIHRAVKSIYSSDCDIAIAGGVNIILHPLGYIALSKNGMLSSDGQCKTFDKSANGYVRGEGIGTLLLKPLSIAEEDGDHIYGVIKGSAENHGGRTNSLTAPNPNAHAQVIQDAYEEFNIDPATVTYIEAHGTGTSLGDPIEVNGLKMAFENLFRKWNKAAPGKAYCGLGSVKTNIGHLEGSAGIAGVFKILLAMKYKKLPGTLHLNELNPYIELEGSPFYIVHTTQDWAELKDESGKMIPRRAGVSSFGFGGSNAHIIFEEYCRSQDVGDSLIQSDVENYGGAIIILSARNEERLKAYAQELIDFIKGNNIPDLKSIAYTLQVGRDSMSERLATVASSREELIERLSDYYEGKKNIKNLFTGKVEAGNGSKALLIKGRAGQEFLKALMDDKELDRLAELWVSGIEVDWSLLYPDKSLKRISIPTYPFARERYWILGSKSDTSMQTIKQGVVVGLHPLIDSNESTFEEQSFKKMLKGEDFYLKDHVLGKEKVLPGVAYLEMARSAGDLARIKTKVRKLKDIVWVRPIAVDSVKEAYVKLYPNRDKIEYKIVTRGEDKEWYIHSQGKIEYDNQALKQSSDEHIDVEEIKKRCQTKYTYADIYKFIEMGNFFNYGPSFKPIKEYYFNDTEALTLIELPAEHQESFHKFLLHPSLMEGALQTAGFMNSFSMNKGKSDAIVPYLPFEMAELEIVRPLSRICYGYAISSDSYTSAKSQIKKYNIYLADESGLVMVKIKNYMMRSILSNTIDKAESAERIYYSSKWKEVELSNKPISKGILDTILIFDYNEKMRDALVSNLTKENDSSLLILVRPGEHYQNISDQIYEINPSKQEDYAELFTSLFNKKIFPSKIIHAWSQKNFSSNEESLKTELNIGIYSLFYLSQALMAQRPQYNIDMVYAYQSKKESPQPQFAALSGFAKVIRLENKKFIYKVIGLDVLSRESEVDYVADVLLSELLSENITEVEIRYEAGRRYVKHLEEINSLAHESDDVLKDKGVYLIVGGAGGLGLIFAEYLAKQVKARLVLVGRSEISSDKKTKIGELEALGSEVLYVRADISKFDDVQDMVDQIRSRFNKIDGVIQSAGIINDSFIIKKTKDEIQSVLASKVYGTIYIDEALKDEDLDFFVMFSSTTSVFGNVGQSDYAFANSFIDSFAEMREMLVSEKKRSGKTLAINWPLWRQGGMKIDEQTEKWLTEVTGIKPLETDLGLEAFRIGLSLKLNQFIVYQGSRKKVDQIFTHKDKSVNKTPVSLKSESAIDNDRLFKSIQKDIVTIACRVLKIEEENIDLDKDMSTFGFDSINIMEFTNQTNKKYDLNITPATFFELESPTLISFMRYLSKEYKEILNKYYNNNLESHRTVDESKGIEIESINNDDIKFQNRFIVQKSNAFNYDIKRDNFRDDIAIIGMSGVMPKSKDLDIFWKNLEEEKDLVSEVPKDRWDWEIFYGDPEREANKTNSKWGGFMDEIDKFDALFFHLSPHEAESMDPQQRIFIETVWATIEDAGYKVSDLSGTKTGLYVGLSNSDYTNLLGPSMKEIGFNYAIGNNHPFLVNRISYMLNLNGPSQPINTLCSSSLVAIHRGVEDIRNGTCDFAIVGGVSVMASPIISIMFSSAGMLGKDGRCKTFDKDADGFVRGEGSGALLLKPLQKAEMDGDHIYAVIKGSAENHGGHANSLTAPNPNAQAEVIKTAYERAQIDITTVSYIEAHGTGTVLGDPVEINGLKKAFKEMNTEGAKKAYCGIGAVKTNIGHLESAAGIAGILKVILAMQYKKLPASLHFKELNPYISLDETPFYLINKTMEWKALKNDDGSNIPRRAGVSSFGAGGSNAHIVLQEYEELFHETPQENKVSHIFVLSAIHEDRLKAYVQRLLDYCEKIESKDDTKKNSFTLFNIAYTLQIGRDAMEERLAIVTGNMDELVKKLTQYYNGNKSIQDLYRGNIKHSAKSDYFIDGDEGKNYIRNLIENRKIDKLAQLWVSGIDIDWKLLYSVDFPQRISLPTYPFERERYWISYTPDPNTYNKSETFGKKLHPLIDSNESTLEEQLYRKELFDDEFYLRDHVVRNEKILPGVVYLEMARLAGDLANNNYKVKKLKNIIWAKPIVIHKSPQVVDIGLHLNANSVYYEISTMNEYQKEIHGQGEVTYEDHFDSQQTDKIIDIEAIKARCVKTLSKNDCYTIYKSVGFLYGASFQVIQKLYYNESEALSHLLLPVELKNGFKDFVLHPSLMDGAMQTILGLMMDSHALYLPFSMDEIVIVNPLTESCYVYMNESKKQNSNPHLKKFDLYLLDEKGLELIRIKDFTVRIFKQDQREASLVNQENIKLMYYQNMWAELPLIVSEPVNKPFGTTLILNNNNELKDYIFNIQNNIKIVQVKYGDAFTILGNAEYIINPKIGKDYVQLFDDLTKESLLPSTIIHMWSYDPIYIVDNNKIEDLLALSIYPLFYITQTIMSQKLESKIKFFYLYQSSNEYLQPHSAAISSFAKTVYLESPKLFYKSIEIRNSIEFKEDSRHIVDLINREFQSNDMEHEVLYDQGQRYIRHFKEIDAKSISGDPLPLKENGVYIITGGAGGIGLLCAHYLAQKRVNIVLIGRSALDNKIKNKIAELESLGSQIIYIKADVSKYEQIEESLKEVKSRFNEINGILHCAGIIKDSFIIKKTIEEMESVLAPKIYGTINLDAALKNEKLDFFLLFSSIAAVMGSVGQCDYAYSNSFMDNFAEMRHGLVAKQERYGKTISINWPLWEQGGMKIDEQSQIWMKNILGFVSLNTENGIRAIEDGLRLGVSQLLVIKGDEGKVKNIFIRSSENQQNNEYVPDERSVESQDSKDNSNDLLQEAEKFLKEILSKKTKFPIHKIQSKEALEKYGIDSVMIINLTRELEKHFGILSKTLFFEYQTIADLAEYFTKNYQQKMIEILGNNKNLDAKKTRDESDKNLIKRSEANKNVLNENKLFSANRNRFINREESVVQSDYMLQEDIAVIGLYGRYPLAKDLTEYWDNLKEGRDCITEIPVDRWNINEYFDSNKNNYGKSYSKWGGFIENVDKFDPLFFNISPSQASIIDPQERLFLETVWATIEDAGYAVKDLQSNRVGVFVGVMYGQYQIFKTELNGNIISPLISYASIANRVSYFFNFQGPSIALDTMCSSSLTTLHLACESIKRKESDIAIAGGVNISIHPDKYIQLSLGGFLSSDGRCRSFGEGGDGYVPGEGVGAALLKPIRKAIEDRDHIYGVIKGVSINHGGKTNGYSVPNPVAQASLISEVLKKTNIDPRTVSYLEAHGTGTSLGDPIEITGLIRAFKEYTSDKQYCSIGSVKSNIGHLESAAGIAGLTKVLFQMKYKKLVPSIHSDVVNPNINFTESPFYIQHTLVEWRETVIREGEVEKRYPRRAGLSSFGAGGANAHVIVEEYEKEGTILESDDKCPWIAILSAKDEERLKDYILKFVKFLERNNGSLMQEIRQDELIIQELKNDIARLISNVLKVDKSEISFEENINEYGFDQIKFNELSKNIKEKYTIDITSDYYSMYPSINSFIRSFYEEFKKELSNYYNGLLSDSSGTYYIEDKILLPDIAYTLQVGRESMDERLAVVVWTLDDLIEKLNKYYRGENDIEGLYHNNIKKKNIDAGLLISGKAGEEFINTLIVDKETDRIAQLWVAGVDIDWRLLYADSLPQRISLPTYPFSRERYWISEFNMKSSMLSMNNIMKLHPLIDSNESTLEEQCFKKIIYGKEYYVKDYSVKGGRMLPYAVYLEMARVAGNLAEKGLRAQRIKDIVWSEPLVLSENPSLVSISLYPQRGIVGYEITTPGDNKRLIHSQGKLVYSENSISEMELIDIELVKNRCSKRLDSVETYAWFHSLGLDYGLGFQSIQELSYNEHELIAHLVLPEQYHNDLHEYVLHPIFMNSALQSVIALIKNISHALYMPSALEEIEIIKPLLKECYVYASLSENAQQLEEIKRFNLFIINESGEVLVKFMNVEYDELEIQHEEKRVVSEKDSPASKDEALYILKKSWEESEGVTQNFEGISNTMIILTNEESRGIAEKLLEGHKNIKGIVIQNGLNYEKRSDYDYIIQFNQLEDGTKAARDILDRGEKVAFLIDLSDLERKRIEGGKGCLGRISLLQQLIRDIRHIPFNILHITHGLQIFKTEEASLSGAEIAGLFKMLGAEYKKVQSKTVDIDVPLDRTDEISDIIRHELTIQYEKSEICYRNGKRYMPYMQKIYSEDRNQEHEQNSHGIIIDPEKVIVITGGVRGIGFEVAQHFIKKGARKLVLMGIQKLPDRHQWDEILSDAGYDKGVKNKIKGIKSLEDKGVQIEVYTGPLVEYDKLNEFFTYIRRNMGEIFGVIHCAGVELIDNPAFINKTQDEMDRVFEPKIKGLEVLHRIFEMDKLNFFILFSSVSALIPIFASAISVYGAANAFMNYYAEYQFKKGNRYYKSINWPNWKEVGMRVTNSLIYKQMGFTSHRTVDGLMMLDRSMSYSDESCVMPCIVNRSVFKLETLLFVKQEQKQIMQLLSNIENASKELVNKDIDFSSTKEWLTELFSSDLKIPKNKLDGNTNFGDFGVDSILLVSLIRSIEKKLGNTIDPSIFLEYSTLNKLSAYIHKNYTEKIENKNDKREEYIAQHDIMQTQTRQVYTFKHQREILPLRNKVQNRFNFQKQSDIAIQKIAVIGLSCHFPGAGNKDEFWNNLVSGKSSITEVPVSRWDAKKSYSASKQRWKSISKWGGFIDDVEYFDPVYFNIKEETAAQLDPLIRQFLEVSAETLRDAGYEKDELWNRNVGVFVGSRMGNYASGIQEASHDTVSGAGQNFIAAHISHFFNFKGPNMLVDTACSSSIVSIHLACQSLMLGESEYALAGGVDILFNEMLYITLSQGGALSPDGKCHTFDEKANGFVPGEGCGAVLLKRLDDAVRDGDHIYAVIDASAINNDGHTMGITTPNPEAQKEVILEALNKGGIEAGSISYIEAHGTGTMIGDPIELKALTQVFRKFTDEKEFCAVGSVKTNVGHLLSAAGIVSFIKVVLSIYNKKLVPTLNCERPNPRFEFENSPFYPNNIVKDWEPREGVRRAGISSFGFGGTNAHIIISEFYSQMIPDYQRRRESLPSVEFKRKRYWLDNKAINNIPINIDNGGNGKSKKGMDLFSDFFQFSDVKRIKSDMED